ncbi:enoyl-CoA hydratase/isomerase family protein [Nocardia wallacei]|uniref:enoyl-CoA hydratase/isomerase family protein n=1 Tax=Nocardia wallacei TaxID=480035 RepID=UPI0024547680|nr:enoyl-CoA hydratase/isomerase family protein [Nocardia wallacei]
MTLVVHRGATWRVRLDRPEAANALSPALVEGLHDVLAEAAEIRPEALVLKGNSRHFAAGFDLAGLSRESDASLAHRFLRIGLLLERLATAPYLTVAVVEGSAIGAGADLVAACDHRLAGPGARFAFPGARFGVVLGTARLRGITDPSVFLGGGTVAAADAAGLVTGTPGDLTAILDAWAGIDPATRPALLAAARPVHDADAALAALARSVTRPGLHDRLSAYRRRVRSPRSHSEELE